MITYDDAPEIRRIFQFAKIQSWRHQYGMNNFKQQYAAKGKELLITNY
jgi:DNA adenine methylase